MSLERQVNSVEGGDGESDRIVPLPTNLGAGSPTGLVYFSPHMARLPAWAEDPEQNAFAARAPSAGGSRFKRVFVGLAVVGIATFVAAYYLPLYRAHETLTTEQRALSQKLEGLEVELGKTRRELENVTREKSELTAERDERERAAKAEVEKVSSLKRDLEAKLEKFTAKGSVALTLAGERVIVAVPEAAAFLPAKSDVSPRGKVLLCEIAKAASGRALEVGAVSGEAPATFDSNWAFTAGRAAAAVATLESKCGVSAQKLSAKGYGAESSPEAMREFVKLPNRLEIAVTP
jgi:chemotaxis protein MotB